MADLTKKTYVICPLYKAKRRYKILDKKHSKVIDKFEVLECNIIKDTHKYDCLCVEILDTPEQHKFTHHKKQKKNKIWVDESTTSNNKNFLEELKDIQNRNIRLNQIRR